MRQSLLFIIILVSTLNAFAQTENKELEMEVFKTWLSEPLQSNISDYSSVGLRSFAVEVKGRDATGIIAEGPIRVNGSKRQLFVSFYFFEDNKYQIAAGPRFGPSEEEAAAVATEKKEADYKAAASRLFVTDWKPTNSKINEHSYLSISIVEQFAPPNVKSGENYWGNTPLFQAVFADTEGGPWRIKFVGLSLGEMQTWNSCIVKFFEWAKTAADNKVTDYSKVLGTIRPSVNGKVYRLTFSISKDGIASLDWSGNEDLKSDDIFSQSFADVQAMSDALNVAFTQMGSLHESCLKRAHAGEDIKPVKSKDDLFK